MRTTPTNHDRAQINRSHPCIDQFCVLVIYLSGKNGDISALHQFNRKDDVQYGFYTREHTPYDSPAMWNALPLNLLKCSKNMATKAAISLAASGVVFFGRHLSTFLQHSIENHSLLILHNLHMRIQRRLVGQRKRYSPVHSMSMGCTSYYPGL